MIASNAVPAALAHADLEAVVAEAVEALAPFFVVWGLFQLLPQPFAGRLGIREVNLGQYLEVSKPIVSLQSLSPVYADFSLTQQELARLNTGMKVRVTTDVYLDKPFEGKLSAINPDLDQSTRSVGLQATLENPDQLLRPGLVQ